VIWVASYYREMERDQVLAVLNQESRRTAALLGILNRAVGARLGLNPTDIDILGLLSMTGTITPKRLSGISGLGTGTITLVIDRLEKAGFVQRVPDPRDRRSVLIELLPGRQGEAAALYARVQQGGAQLLAEYDDRDLTLISDYLRRSNDMLRDAAAELLKTAPASTGRQPSGAGPG
jgi:DNA-binding MarR family transcriptional regulator